MRSSLYELPILLTCMRAGAAAGGISYVILLPRTIFEKYKRGVRRGFWLGALFVFCDLLVPLVSGAIFASAILFCTGGEIRLYALSGFCLTLALCFRLLKTLFI